MSNNPRLFENGCQNPDLIVAFSTKIQASGENSGGRGEDILRKGRFPVPTPRSIKIIIKKSKPSRNRVVFDFLLDYFKFTKVYKISKKKVKT